MLLRMLFKTTLAFWCFCFLDSFICGFEWEGRSEAAESKEYRPGVLEYGVDDYDYDDNDDDDDDNNDDDDDGGEFGVIFTEGISQVPTDLFRVIDKTPQIPLSRGSQIPSNPPKTDLPGGSKISHDQLKTGLRSGSLAPDYPAIMTLPNSLRILASQVRKDLFKPGPGPLQVPPAVRDILLASIQPVPLLNVLDPKKLVEVRCHLDRMYVRIRKSHFYRSDAWKYLRIGTCPVNEGTFVHYYFLYLLEGCGLSVENLPDCVTFTNTIYYSPPMLGPVVREFPFSIQITCRYHKFFNLYHVGFKPIVQEETHFNSLPIRTAITLKAYNEQWQPLGPGEGFIIGTPMYFEIIAAVIAANQRVYLSECYAITPDPVFTSKLFLVNNYGCMVDSKVTPQSKFIATTRNDALRFSIGAFMFQMVHQSTQNQALFMYCKIVLGPAIPTSSSKACTYYPKTDQWMELYGNHSVCSCCKSTCPPPNSDVNDMSYRRSVELNYAMKSTKSRAFKILEPEESDFVNGGANDGFERFRDTIHD